MLNVALPKGRLGDKVYEMFEAAGFPCPDIRENNRKLIFENKAEDLRFFAVKPMDVAIYVERGAADVGVVGKDVLAEFSPEIYELLDLGIGRCRMAVAAPAGFQDTGLGALRVATKYPAVARDWYAARGRDIDVIRLKGSIEIAPKLGLSDVIVDIVETGATLRENGLAVIEDLFPISARLIVNKASYKFKGERIDRLVRELSQQTEGKA